MIVERSLGPYYDCNGCMDPYKSHGYMAFLLTCEMGFIMSLSLPPPIGFCRENGTQIKSSLKFSFQNPKELFCWIRNKEKSISVGAYGHDKIIEL